MTIAHVARHRGGVGAAVALAALVLGASCKKPEPPPVVRSCVLTGGDGKTVQCFEHRDARTKEAQQQWCSVFEVAPGGSKTLQDGPCPAEGRKGYCVHETSPGARIVCYGDAAHCEDNCKSSFGVFTRE